MLFILFYAATYKQDSKRRRRRSSTATARQGVIDMAKMEVPSPTGPDGREGAGKSSALQNGSARTTRSRKA